MLSFEEKKAVFLSFQKLKEKEISNGRVSFVYPESKQRGQVLATQLHPSGNGYVNGKYMSEETIEANGYTVDSRGWISIKDFTKDELLRVIALAMKSMSGVKVEQGMKGSEDGDHDRAGGTENIEEMQGQEQPIVKMNHEERTSLRMTVTEEKEPTTIPPKTIQEPMVCSLLFGWVGLSVAAVECGTALWKKVWKYREL